MAAKGQIFHVGALDGALDVGWYWHTDDEEGKPPHGPFVTKWTAGDDMRRSVRVLDGGRRVHYMSALSCYTAPLVVTRGLVKSDGYTIILTSIGATIALRHRLRDARAALKTLLASDIDWTAPIGLEYCREHDDLRNRINALIGSWKET